MLQVRFVTYSHDCYFGNTSLRFAVAPVDEEEPAGSQRYIPTADELRAQEEAERRFKESNAGAILGHWLCCITLADSDFASDS